MKFQFHQGPARLLTAWLLAFLLALSQGVPVFAATETVSVTAIAAAQQTLTRAEARDVIFAAASRYHGGLKASDVMSGYPDGALRDGQAVTRAEALTMISRAFGALPAPVGDKLRRAIAQPAEYTDAPKWATPALANLNEGRILTDSADKRLNPGQAITAAELDTILHRVFALYGTNLKDDFYAAINKEWLDTAELKTDDGGMRSTFDEIGDRNKALVDALIDEVVKGTWAKGTPERKILDAYNAILDKTAQAKTGVAPITPYLETLAAVSALKDLEKAQTTLASELEFYPFVAVECMPGFEDNTKYVPVAQSSLSYDEGEYDEAESLDCATRLFELAGVKNPAERAVAAIKIDAILERAWADRPDRPALTFDRQITKYTPAQIQAWLPNADMKTLLTLGGLKEEPYYWAHYETEHMLTALGKLYTDENAAALAAHAQYQLLCAYQAYMGADFAAVGEEEEDLKPAVQEAHDFVKNTFSDYFSKAYIKRYFPAEAKADVTAMINMFIDNYKARLQKNTWLSEATKAMALKKLNTLTVRIGYSDLPDELLPGLEFAGVDEGGSCPEMVIAIARQNGRIDRERRSKPVNREEWDFPAFIVNASYNPSFSAFTFPAGILQAPLYDVNAKPEVNFAGIGWVIAHEITHAFDVNGSMYDEKGNIADWWTAEDRAAFAALNAAVVAHYDGAELAPGIATNGERTLAENTADLGGISCALEALRQKVASPDYKLFFTSATKAWRFTALREKNQMLARIDTHSSGTVRVNRLIQNFDEFYEAFDIKEGDGMYVPPEKRVKVW